MFFLHHFSWWSPKSPTPAVPAGSPSSELPSSPPTIGSGDVEKPLGCHYGDIIRYGEKYANLQLGCFLNVYQYNGISYNIISWDYFWDVFIVVFDAEGRFGASWALPMIWDRLKLCWQEWMSQSKYLRWQVNLGVIQTSLLGITIYYIHNMSICHNIILS